MDLDEEDLDEGGPGPATASVDSASKATSGSHEIGQAPDATRDTTSETAGTLPPLSLEAVAPSSPLHPSSSTSPRLPHLADILNASTINAFNPDDPDLSSTVPPSTSSSGPLSSGVPAPASPHQGQTLRQLALYQALSARGHQQPSSTLPSFPTFPSHLPSLSSFVPTSPTPFHLPHAPPPTPAFPQYASSTPDYPSLTENNLSADSAMPPASHKWQTNLDGLNVIADPPPWTATNGHAPARSGPAASFGGVSANELLAAQASLDLWASTSFSSPGLSTGMSLAGTPAPAPTSHLPSLHSVSAAAEHHPAPPSTLDWSALYPHGNPFSPPNGSTSSPLPSASSLGLSHHASSAAHPSSLPHAFAAPHSVELHGSQFSGLFSHSASSSTPHLTTSPHLTANGAVSADSQSPQHSPPSTSHGGRPTPSRRSSRPNAGAKGKAARASFAAVDAADDEGDVSPGEMSGGSGGLGVGITAAGKKVPRELMTAEEIEEDKRRRNTEASARFRAKKKLRDQELQQTSAQLRERVANLEREKESLSNENRWLRDIVAEKAEVRPGLLDVLRRSSLSEG